MVCLRNISINTLHKGDDDDDDDDDDNNNNNTNHEASHYAIFTKPLLLPLSSFQTSFSAP